MNKQDRSGRLNEVSNFAAFLAKEVAACYTCMEEEDGISSVSDTESLPSDDVRGDMESPEPSVRDLLAMGSPQEESPSVDELLMRGSSATKKRQRNCVVCKKRKRNRL